MKRKIKVLIVDDSALVRQTLTEILSYDNLIEVMGTANNPFDAVEIIKKDIPDVITLDIDMPKMDGLTFLKKLMSQHPIPVIIISGVAEKGSQKAINALNYGAVDVIQKPKVFTPALIEEYKITLTDVIKAAAISKIRRINSGATLKVEPKLSADAVIKKEKNTTPIFSERVIAIGASTGGTEAILKVLFELPETSHGIIIVQHMPEHFTKSFADRLNSICKIRVKEAEDGDLVEKGLALIAPGNKHVILKNINNKYYVNVIDGPLVNRHRPSVDVMFRSVAQLVGKNAIGVLLTGMGDDGAKGLLELKEAGALTIAQDERSCVVFGMPKEAIALDAAMKILPLELIHQNIAHHFLNYDMKVRLAYVFGKKV